MATNPLVVIVEARRRVERAQRREKEAIRDAFCPDARRQFRYTVDDIADAAGLSRPRIYQIVKESDHA